MWPPISDDLFAPKCLENDRLSYWVPVTFQGRTIKLRGGNRVGLVIPKFSLRLQLAKTFCRNRKFEKKTSRLPQKK